MVRTKTTGECGHLVGGGTKRPRGVTAVELLTLVVLLVVLVAFAIPGMSPVVLNMRLKGAAWQLAGDLRLARQRAVTNRKRFRICLTGCAISVPRGTYSLERDDGVGASALWVSDMGAPIRLPDGVSVTASATPVFNQNGMANGSTFTVSNPIGSRQVVVSSTGRVQVP